MEHVPSFFVEFCSCFVAVRVLGSRHAHMHMQASMRPSAVMVLALAAVLCGSLVNAKADVPALRALSGSLYLDVNEGQVRAHCTGISAVLTCRACSVL